MTGEVNMCALMRARAREEGWATDLSASSRMTILCRPAGRVTFFCANILILFLTTSIPLEKSSGPKTDVSSGRARRRTRGEGDWVGLTSRLTR